MPDLRSSKDSLLSFPCEFPIKVMGKDSLEFQAAVLTIIRKHVPDLGEAAIDIRSSRGGKYIGLTVNIKATSQEQLDNIYQELTSNDLVLVAL